MDFKLDKDQERAVACNTNAVVAAGAGSGKTRVLSLRFLRLITEGKAKVDQILTLTFTRKAAAEMHERIYKLLLSNKDHPLVQNALKEFDNSVITTLDSFSSQIIRSGGRRFGIPATFQVDEQALSALAAKESYFFLLEHHSDPSISSFISAHGFETVWKQFFMDLAVTGFDLTNPDDYYSDLQGQLTQSRSLIEESLGELEHICNSILGLELSGKTMTNAREAAELFLSKLPLEDLFTAESGEKEILSELETLTSAFQLRKTTAKASDAQLYNELKVQSDTARTTLLSALRFYVKKELYENLFSLVDEFKKRFLSAKRSAGLLGFADLLKTANHILLNDVSLRDYYKRRFTHIMIDEFQDNNKLQKELLYLLSEKQELSGTTVPSADDLKPDKLFFVGDEKQSIYLFRGADVRVFKGLGEEITHSGGSVLKLGTNYRSHPALISFFNSVFPKILGNGEISYEAGFTALESRVYESDGPESTVSLKYLPDNDEFRDNRYLNPTETEACTIGRYILDAVSGKGPMIESPRSDAAGKKGEDVTSVPAFSDFAVLMRSSSSQIHYEKMFRRMGIPYTTRNVRTLFLEAPTNDIYCLLQLAVYPEDRFAYAGYLRSPFVHLNDNHTVELIAGEQPPFSVDAATLGMSETEAQKYDTGRRVLEDVRCKLDKVPIKEILEYVWYECGYRFTLLRNPEYHGYLDYIEYLGELARQFDQRGEATVLFLDFLSRNLGDYKKLDETNILKDAGNSVQIMTIHSSKGLEFPFVILAAAGQSVRDQTVYSPYYVSEEYGLTVHLLRDDEGRKINPFYELDKEKRALYEKAELKRLLYVALTRAEQHLLIIGSHTRNNKQNDAVMLNMIFQGLDAGENPNDHPLVERVDPIEITEFYSTFSKSRNNNASLPARDLSEKVLLEKELALPKRELSSAQCSYTVTELNGLYCGLNGNAAVRGSDSLVNTSADNNQLGLFDRGPQLPGLSCDPLLLEKEAEGRFGTLVHWMCEFRLKGQYSRDIIDERLLEGFSVNERELLIDDAEQLCANIPSVVTEQIAQYGGAFEEPFTVVLPGVRDTTTGSVLTAEGQFDLYIETDKQVFLYDFKTDKEVRESEYDLQIALYSYALHCITEKPVKAALIYLRDGNIVPMDSQISDFDLGRLLFS